jgi:hypothetical protein
MAEADVPGSLLKSVSMSWEIVVTSLPTETAPRASIARFEDSL